MAKLPEMIGKYEVIRLLAQGGMGAVYAARHPTLDRTVIIKKLTLRGNADIRERFRREAQIMMDLRNDAIVDVYDHFREGTSYFIVLEYVDGASLEDLIRRRRYLPSHIALLVLREVCRALAYAHSRGVVHRDIKPANILLSNRGEVKLVDFGIATIRGVEESDLTREGMTLGTPSYMAPEQFQNTRSVDHRADVYSVGVVLYEMVTGKRPYPGSFTPEVLARIQKGRYDRPRRINPKVSRFASALIRRMLRPAPKRRFSDLGTVITLIDRRLRLEPHAPAKSTLEKYIGGDELADAPRRRHPLRVAAVLIAALVVAGAVGAIVGTGYHNDLFRPGRVGAVSVDVRVVRGEKPPEEVYLAGRLESSGAAAGDAAAAEGAAGQTLRFRRVAEEDSARFYVYRSQRLYAAPGDYRLVVEAESTLWWESFEVRSLRAENGPGLLLPGNSDSALTVVVDLVESLQLPVSVDVRVTDQQTRREVSGARLSVWLNGMWRAWGPFTSGSVRSGNTYRFRVDHPLYRSQLLDVEVKPYQNRLFLDVALERR